VVPVGARVQELRLRLAGVAGQVGPLRAPSEPRPAAAEGAWADRQALVDRLGLVDRQALVE
jgi:hypothetical protein